MYMYCCRVLLTLDCLCVLVCTFGVCTCTCTYKLYRTYIMLCIRVVYYCACILIGSLCVAYECSGAGSAMQGLQAAVRLRQGSP